MVLARPGRRVENGPDGKGINGPGRRLHTHLTQAAIKSQPATLGDGAVRNRILGILAGRCYWLRFKDKGGAIFPGHV
jgi:hypothetical protein